MQTCNFCDNPENVLNEKTTCNGCRKLKDSSDPVIQEIRRLAMNSEHGGVWYSDNGTYVVSKDGEFKHLFWKMKDE